MNRISHTQLFMLTALFLYSTPTAFLVGPMTADAGYSSWAAVIAASAWGLLIIYMCAAISRRRADQFFASYGRQIVSKYAHFPLMAIFILYFGQRAAILLQELIDFIGQYTLPQTPGWAIAVLLGGCAALTVFSGVVVIFRLTQLLFVIVCLLILAFPIMASTVQINSDLLVALVTNLEWRRLWVGTFETSPWYGDMLFVLFLFPYFNKPEKITRPLFWGIHLATLFLLLYLVPTVLAYGPYLTGRLTYPALEFFRSLRIADFIETLDPLMIFLWIPIVLTKLSLFLYVTVHSFVTLIGVKNHKPFSFYITIIVIAASLYMTTTTIQIQSFKMHVWPWFAIAVQSLPLLYLIIDGLRNIGQGTEDTA